MKFKCANCSIELIKTGRNHKLCKPCAKERNKAAIKAWAYKVGRLNGQGSGSKKGTEASNYVHGLCTFKRWAKEKLELLHYCCERCGKHIDVSKRGSWAGHHKDHDRSNNVETNLEVLCKQCHQVEHECWTAFEGVTTISKESTQEIVEAHSTQNG